MSSSSSSQIPYHLDESNDQIEGYIPDYRPSSSSSSRRALNRLMEGEHTMPSTQESPVNVDAPATEEVGVEHSKGGDTQNNLNFGKSRIMIALLPA